MSDKLNQMSGCSAVLVARLNGVQEAVSSILATRIETRPTISKEIVGLDFLFGCFRCAFPDEGEGTNVNDVAVALIGKKHRL